MLVAWDMNQHLILCWVSQPNLLNLRFYPLSNPLPRGEGMMVLKTDHYQTFCNLSPLPVGEG